MIDGISRDILVPSTMTLHELHYAIQQLFGCQSGHLHHFQLPRKIFQQLVDNRFHRWGELCGVYFRFPTEDVEALYCNDDYDGSLQFSTWLRRSLEYKTAIVKTSCSAWGITGAFSERLHSKTHFPKAPTLDEVFRNIFFESVPTELLKQLRLQDLLFLSPPPQDDVLSDCQTLPLPVTTELWYYYDYGNNWKVHITLGKNSSLAQEHPQIFQQKKPICI